MKVITPIAPAIPATTAIQDPAARRFAQAVSDALSALQSSEGSVRTLAKAAEALTGAAAGGVPAGIAQWLFSSELYAKLSSEIVRVDLAAKQQTIAEALARQEAISAIQATLADIGSTAAYDPGATYAIGDMVTFDSKLYRAIAATTGNLPTDTAFWEKVGDYATLGDVVAAHTLSLADHESRIDATEAGLSAEVSERSSLAAQVRGGYSGTDANAVTQGLIYSERVARASADSTEVAARQSLSAKLTGATDPTGLTLATLASGLVFDEKTARVSAVGAVATSVSVLQARTTATEGAILAEQTVRAGNDNALVSAINTAWAITGATNAVIESGGNLVTNWTTGQANYWTTLNAEVFTAGGQTIRAALAEEATVRATQTGQLYGQYTVKIDTNGYVAGFGLASSSSTAGAGTSSFVIRADKFAMVMPGYGNYVPFAIGAGGIEFNGNMAWSGVTGSNKPIDNSGRVIDLGSGTSPGQRNANDPPSYYPVGKTLQFKWGGALDIEDGGWLTLETNKQWGDNSGGMVTQWAYGQNGRTWKRSGNPADASWGAWTQDLDRNAYTGDLNATYGATWNDTLAGKPSDDALLNSKAVANRNLVRGFVSWGHTGSNWTYQAGVEAVDGTLLVLPQTGTPWQVSYSPQGLGVWAGAHITVSFRACNWTARRTLVADIDSINPWASSVLLDLGWKTYEFQWDIPAGTTQASLDAARLRFFAGTEAGDVYIADVKLEVSWGRTPWTPHRLDSVSPLNKLTYSNVVTYIDNAAIQNAQIGGNIWSSNYAAGSAGWIIDRTGYAEFRNILARGNIEATSIKADAVDVVSTLNIAGDAVVLASAAQGGSDASVSITVPASAAGRPLIVWFSGKPLMTSQPPVVVLKLNGTEVSRASGVGLYTEFGNINTDASSFAMIYPAAGSHTLLASATTSNGDRTATSVKVASLLGKR